MRYRRLVTACLALVAWLPCANGESPPATIQDLTIAKGFIPLLQQAPFLWEGGNRIFAEDDAWIALGVGVGPLVNAERQPITVEDATKVAAANARAELAKAIHGVTLNAGEELKTIVDGDTNRTREMFHSFSREQTAAVLGQAEQIGSWKFRKGKLVAVLVATASPQHPLMAGQPAGIAAVRFRNVQLDGPWRTTFRAHAGILTGGVALHHVGDGDAVLLLAVGKAKLQGNPEADVHKERLATNHAAREILQFINGVQLRGTEEYSLEQVRGAGGKVLEKARETFRSVRSEKISGLFHHRPPVGSWESLDGQFYYAAFAINLGDLK